MSGKLKKTLKHVVRGGAAFAFACTLALTGSGAASAVSSSDDSFLAGGAGGFCVPFNAPVALGEGLPYDQRVSGTYCQPFKFKGTPQVDVLTSGAGYTSAYWNWPVKPDKYSYVQKTLAEGRATLAYDRVGSGKSSHPVSTAITLDSDAFVLHSIVQVLRLGGYGFQKVNSIGHSYGSGVVLQEAAKYAGVGKKDVSRVIVTGYLHNPRDPSVGTRNYPANQDPQFAASGFDNGYLTSRPGTRGLSFYNTAFADPAVIAYDEAHKDVVSLTAFLGYAAQQGAPVSTNVSNSIIQPVMAIVGQQDAIFCVTPAVLNCANVPAVQAYEAPYYSHSTSFTANSVPNTGHDIALHPSAFSKPAPTTNSSFTTIDQWIKTH